MFEREPNIDVVFRNGLKNLEVLPPTDVWDNIPPMPVRGTRSRVFTGIAAGIAALLTLTLVASWFTRSDSATRSLSEVTLAENGQPPETGQLISSSPVVREVVRAESEGTIPTEIPDYEITITGNGETLMPSLSSTTEINRMGAGNATDDSAAADNITVIAQGLAVNYNAPEELLSSGKSVDGDQRFMVGASMSPSVGFSSSGNDAHISELMSGEKIRPAYTTGLAFGYRISKRITIQSGIGLSSMGQVINGIDVFAGLSDFYAVKSDYLYSVETTSGVIMTGNPDLYLADSKNRVESMIPGNIADPSKYPLTQVGSNIHQVFRYLELPLLIRYKVIDRSIDLNFSGGMSYGLLVDNFAYTKSGSDMIPIGHTAGVNMHSLSSQIGLGMEYNVSGRFTFNVEPVFRYYVTPFNDLSGTLYRPYSFGLFSGFFYKF
ncbi:MAG: outer membrane beta-barrel protein [Bacteroidales bacterium]|nr:outer membrane beta-barrel protein [Bacteroidales bacterium]